MIRHHPSTETLLAYAAGTLRAGHALVVSAHLQGCIECQHASARLEAIGGALLEDLPPDTLPADAFTQALAALEHKADESNPRHAPPLPAPKRFPTNFPMPQALHGTRVGRWIWVGRGVYYSRLHLPWAPQEHVMLIRVAANRPVISHSHGGREFTQILQGSYHDETGYYQQGDMAEETHETKHQPCAGEQGCLSLAALENGLRLPWLKGLINRSAA